MTEGHSARATRALQHLSEADPAFASLSLWCHHRDAGEGGDGAAAWTDGRTIFYGVAFEALAVHEQVGLAAHQILHVAFRHVGRSRAMYGRFGDRFDAEIYNIATDAIVNETLVLAGHALPRPCVMLGALLREALGETVDPGRAIGDWDAERLYLRLVHGPRGVSGDSDPRDRDAESGAGGSPEAQRARAHARSRGFGQDLRGRDDAADAAHLIEDDGEWRQRVARALEAGKLAGRGIGALGRRLADLPRSETPWESILRALVARAVDDRPGPAWLRPARRWIARDSEARRSGGAGPAFEAGAMRMREVPRIAVGIDASGSIGDDVLALFGAQIAGIGRRTGAEVHVFVFDDGVRSHTKLRGGSWEAEIGRLDFARGGGTSFVEVLAAAARIGPSIIILLTDLDGPAGAPPARVPVVWATPNGAPHRAPPFGRHVSLAR